MGFAGFAREKSQKNKNSENDRVGTLILHTQLPTLHGHYILLLAPYFNFALRKTKDFTSFHRSFKHFWNFLICVNEAPFAIS